jgi:hypothetical protein
MVIDIYRQRESHNETFELVKSQYEMILKGINSILIANGGGLVVSFFGREHLATLVINKFAFFVVLFAAGLGLAAIATGILLISVMASGALFTRDSLIVKLASSVAATAAGTFVVGVIILIIELVKIKT